MTKRHIFRNKMLHNFNQLLHVLLKEEKTNENNTSTLYPITSS